jgi:hypothetical protein
MRNLKLAAFAFVISMFSTQAASAGTVLTGSFGPTGDTFGATLIEIPNAGVFGIDFLGEHGHVDLGPGAYKITFSATADIENLELAEAVNQDFDLEVTGEFPASSQFGDAILDQYLPGGAYSYYHAGDVISGTLLVPQNTTSVDVEPFGVFTTTLTYSGVVAVTGDGAPNGDWTLTITGVPEPGIWTTMLFGFGGIGAALRRRRVNVGLTPA